MAWRRFSNLPFVFLLLLLCFGTWWWEEGRTRGAGEEESGSSRCNWEAVPLSHLVALLIPSNFNKLLHKQFLIICYFVYIYVKKKFSAYVCILSTCKDVRLCVCSWVQNMFQKLDLYGECGVAFNFHSAKNSLGNAPIPIPVSVPISVVE